MKSGKSFIELLPLPNKQRTTTSKKKKRIKTNLIVIDDDIRCTVKQKIILPFGMNCKMRTRKSFTTEFI